MVKIKNVILLLLWLFQFVQLMEGQELAYKMELGGMIGGSFYMGDANYSHPYRQTKLVGGAVGRYILSPTMALKGNLSVGKIGGDTQLDANQFPNQQEVAFDRTLFDLGAQFEYNFFAYGVGGGYKRYKPVTPYLLGGFGFTYGPSKATDVFTINFPIGIGVKYKIAPRWNVGVEFTMRFTLSDKLDVTDLSELQLNDPYGINSSMMKNKDSYSYTVLFFTYDLFPIFRKCNNL